MEHLSSAAGRRTYARAIRDSFGLSRMYFTSSDWKAAWALLLTVVGLELGFVYLNVRFTYWNRDFYNALQHKQWAAFIAEIEYFCVLASTWIAAKTAARYLNQWLQIRWRAWHTEHLISRWMHDGRHFRLKLIGDSTDNPDQRIADDIRSFIDTSLSLGIGLLGNVVNLVSFLIILWGLSREASFTLGGFDLARIPGFMVWIAVLYAGLGTWLTHVIGRSLAGLSFEQQRREADFRFNLVRLREHGEAVALLKGEDAERRGLKRRFARVIENFYSIMNLEKYISVMSAAYSQVAAVFPVIIAAPAYFAGHVQLGVLMQVLSSFGNVQGSLSFFIDSYSGIAVWKATVDRLATFAENVDRVDDLDAMTPRIGRSESVNGALEIDGLGVHEPRSGSVIAALPKLSLELGQRTAMVGPSGSGKTSVVRAISGIWSLGRGEVRVPKGASTFILPQQVYVPMGTLAHALTYPADADAFPTDTLKDLLAEVGLPELVDQLDVQALWQDQLSGGERQRLAIARAILAKPDFLVLDEATSALDEASEAALLDLIEKRLPHAAILSIAHKSSVIERYASRVFVERPVPALMTP